MCCWWTVFSHNAMCKGNEVAFHNWDIILEIEEPERTPERSWRTSKTNLQEDILPFCLISCLNKTVNYVDVLYLQKTQLNLGQLCHVLFDWQLVVMFYFFVSDRLVLDQQRPLPDRRSYMLTVRHALTRKLTRSKTMQW